MKKNNHAQTRTRRCLGSLALGSYVALSSVSAQQDITVFDDGESTSINPPPAFGFDITRAEFRYSPSTDVLDIRLRFDGIAGDVDGNGDPDSGPDDSPNFGEGEQIAVFFDLNCDGTDDFVVGISPGQSFTGTENIPLPVTTLPSSTTAVLVNTPSTENPDFQVQITGWSTVGAHSEQFLYRADVDSLRDNRDPDRIEGQVNLSFVGRAQKILEDTLIGQTGETLPDVAIQPGSPAGTISGWDIQTTEFRYDPVADTMEVTLNTFGIAGDADGDGNPGSSSFTPQPTQDLPNLEGSETMAVAFDFDGDSTFDIVAGIPAATGSGITPSLEAEIAVFANSEGNIGQNFGDSDTGTLATAVLQHNPSEAQPDFVMLISNWSQLTTDPFQFGFESFAGSFDDSGIGEDSQAANIALEARPTGRVGFFDDNVNGGFGPDVGIPPGTSNLSGWDFRSLTFEYLPVADKLAIDIDFFGIAGDADGDGDPGVLTARSGGTDSPNLGPGETIAIVIDLNSDGTEDVVIGVPPSGELDPNTLELVIAEFVPGSPGQNFGTVIEGGASAFVTANPSAANPDFNVIIQGWSLLDTNDPSDFSFRVFAGSIVDAGFGEDNIPNPGDLPQAAILVPGIEITQFTTDPETGEATICYSGGLEQGMNTIMDLGSDLNESDPATVVRVEVGLPAGDGAVTSDFFGESEAVIPVESTSAFFRVVSGVDSSR